MTPTEQKIRQAATWAVETRFAGDWCVVTYCQNEEQARDILGYWRQRSSWQYRMVKL